jgi:hypothetical protein
MVEENASVLYKLYVEWCKTKGIPPEDFDTFLLRLQGLGHPNYFRGKERYVRGIKIEWDRLPEELKARVKDKGQDSHEERHTNM